MVQGENFSNNINILDPLIKHSRVVEDINIHRVGDDINIHEIIIAPWWGK